MLLSRFGCSMQMSFALHAPCFCYFKHFGLTCCIVWLCKSSKTCYFSLCRRAPLSPPPKCDEWNVFRLQWAVPRPVLSVMLMDWGYGRLWGPLFISESVKPTQLASETADMLQEQVYAKFLARKFEGPKSVSLKNQCNKVTKDAMLPNSVALRKLGLHAVGCYGMLWRHVVTLQLRWKPMGSWGQGLQGRGGGGQELERRFQEKKDRKIR